MPDYKKLYFTLFNTVTDVIEQLKDVQVACEELYYESSYLEVLHPDDDKPEK